MPDAPRRPPPVTLACLFVGFSAVLIIVNLMSVLGDWGSLDMQEGLRPVLETEPISGTGLTMDQLLSYLRIAAQVVVVLSIAAGVFALHTARGHEPSRWILSLMLVLGALVFVLSGTAGILPGLLAFMCVLALWSRDARRWFALKNGRPVPPSAQEKGAREKTGGAASVVHHPSQQADVSAPHPAATTAAPQAAADPSAAGPAAAPAQTSAGPPRPVALAVWVALGASAAVAALSGFALLVLLVGGDAYREVMEQPGLFQDVLRSSGWSATGLITFMQVSFAVTTVLGALGVGAAAWARSGRGAGRVALVVMSIVTVVVSAIATFGFLPLNLLTLAAAIVVLVQIGKPQSRAWFAARRPS